MYFVTGFILLGLVVFNYRNDFWRIFINLVLSCISVYLYILDKLTYILPRYLYIKSYNYKTNDLDFSIYEYLGKYNNKYYKFKVIEDNYYNSVDAFDIYHPNNMNMINYCGVINKDGNHIRDITKDIRCFMYYRGLIEWKYILVHLGLERHYGIYMCMNDDDITEEILYIDAIYNEKFNF